MFRGGEREVRVHTFAETHTETDFSNNRAQDAIIVHHFITFTMYIHEHAHTQTHTDTIKCTHLPIPVLTNASAPVLQVRSTAGMTRTISR
jgi:hypothetical protein